MQESRSPVKLVDVEPLLNIYFYLKKGDKKIYIDSSMIYFPLFFVRDFFIRSTCDTFVENKQSNKMRGNHAYITFIFGGLLKLS